MIASPSYIFCNGKVRVWDEAKSHASMVHGLNVFENLKAYWQKDGSIGVLAIEDHWYRLRRSARLLGIQFAVTLEELDDACHDLIARLCRADCDISLRATLYGVDSDVAEDVPSRLILTADQRPRVTPEPLDIGICTSARRPASLHLKSGADYLETRLGEIEGRDWGYSDMIMLNGSDRVTGTLASCVMLVRQGTFITPPSSEGALESITMGILERLAKSLGIAFVRRPIDRGELYAADEVALASTLAEVTPVRSIDGMHLGSIRPLTASLRKFYLSAVHGRQRHDGVHVSCRYVSCTQRPELDPV